MKDKVINDLLSRIATLEYEVERQDNIIKEAREYIENETWFNRKDLLKILKGSE